jgi:EAL domain-containing protein (putative c-di-GMP-specific phosphodiesterase class I)
MAIWSRRGRPERVLWTRDSRLVARISLRVAGCRVMELDSGICLIGPASGLSDEAMAGLANAGESFGIADVDRRRPADARDLYAFASAVQASGIADRIGMDQSPQIARTKLLDFFLTLRTAHGVRFQPIVDLETFVPHEWECLFRPVIPGRGEGISELIEAAIATNRTAELDVYLLDRILASVADQGRSTGPVPFRIALNLSPASLFDDRLTAATLVVRLAEIGFSADRVTIEVTEQQAIPDVGGLKRRLGEFRAASFGVAVDDAGAGYASFSLIAALRPTYIKLDREIVQGVAGDVAKRALVEAFVSFSRKIGALLIAEGIESVDDLAVLVATGVDYGQGYLLGRPESVPQVPELAETRDAIAIHGLVRPERGPVAAALGLADDRSGEVPAPADPAVAADILPTGYVPGEDR